MLSAPVNKLQTMLLERRHRVQRKLGIRSHEIRGSGNNHGRYGFVRFEELLDQLGGYGDEVGFYVFGILDEDSGVDYGCERFRG